MSFRHLVLLALLVAVAVLLYMTPRGKSNLRTGTGAPAFQLAEQNGTPVALDSYRGQVVLINFWATWCPPCREEMPSLSELSKRLAGKPFSVLAISVDDSWKPIAEFQKKISPTMTVLRDDPSDVSGRYGVAVLPQSFLLDKHGVIVKKYTGPRDWIDPDLIAEISHYVETP